VTKPQPVLLWWLGTGSVALVLLVVSVVVATSAYGVPLLLAFVAATAQCAALPMVLLRPLPATVLQFAAVAAFSAGAPVDPATTWPLTVPGMLVLITFVGLVAARDSWRRALGIWWGSVLLCILLVLLDPRGRTVSDAEATLIIYTANAMLVLIVTIVVRHGAAVRRQLDEARRDVAVEQSQRAVAEERTRIARELHDVVAHGMSVIHMQATSAPYRIAGMDPESRAEFDRIAVGARSAMREMRQLLAVLRDEAADAELVPVAGLEGLAELAESARRAGVPVVLEVAVPVEVPETVQAAAYRIVQESLSNVIRHAPGARTAVCLNGSGAELAIVVENDPPPAAGAADDEPGGHGLHGMGERVRLLGGTLRTGPRADGGYRVAARLPIGGAG
jgi:signal transduction histidine kinase